MGDINKYFNEEPFRKSRNEFQTEIHNHSGCYYEPLVDWIIIGTNVKIKVLIRICKCGQQTNRERYLNKTIILFSEYGDGVEAHFDDRCEFIEPAAINGVRKFRKVCYCQRPQLSYLR